MNFRLDAPNLPQCTGLAWGELQSCNCKLWGGEGREGQPESRHHCVSWSRHTQTASHWSAAANTSLWLADQGCIRPGSMTPGQRWGWWHLRTPSSWFLKIMEWFRQHKLYILLSTPLENKCMNHGQVKWFPRELFNSDYSPLNVASMQIQTGALLGWGAMGKSEISH